MDRLPATIRLVAMRRQREFGTRWLIEINEKY